MCFKDTKQNCDHGYAVKHNLCFRQHLRFDITYLKKQKQYMQIV